MYIYIYTYIYTHIHTYTYIHTHYIHIHMYIYTYIYTHTYIYTYIHTEYIYAYTHLHKYTHAYTYKYRPIHTDMYMQIYIYILNTKKITNFQTNPFISGQLSKATSFMVTSKMIINALTSFFLIKYKIRNIIIKTEQKKIVYAQEHRWTSYDVIKHHMITN